VLQARVAIDLSEPKQLLYSTFVDFRRPFDSVVYPVLWKSLYEAGISGQMIRVLQSLYQRANMRVKLGNGKKTNVIEVTQGMLQGDSLSPLRFSILLAGIDQFSWKTILAAITGLIF
jgi:hypothetical protein